jgi:DNA-directed RNA polymerase specialized sigma24 family protein
MFSGLLLREEIYYKLHLTKTSIANRSVNQKSIVYMFIPAIVEEKITDEDALIQQEFTASKNCMMETIEEKKEQAVLVILQDEDRCRMLKYEFGLMLKQYGNVITHCLYRYKFWKTPEDKEEYSQEIYLALWRTFVKCRAKGPMEIKTMPAWIMGVAKYAVYSYRRNLHKNQDRVAYLDNDDIFEAVDDPYDESQITTVKLMVTKLPESDRAVMEMVLDEKNLRQESLKIGMSEVYFSMKYRKILNYLRTQASKYFENYKFDATKLFVRPDYRGRSRVVVQLDKDNRILSEYISIAEAALRSGITRRKMEVLVASENGHHNGFFWRYKEGPVIELGKGDRTLSMVV